MKFGDLDIIRSGYETVHDMIVPWMLKMDQARIRKRIVPAINPVVWMIWHVVRVEDMFLSTVVFKEDQEFHSENWQRRLNINTSNVGTGMTTEETDQLSLDVDLDALAAYNQAVKLHSLNLLERVPELQGNTLDSAKEIELRLKESMAFPDRVAEERARAYAPSPVSSCLLGVINHTYMHFGQYLSITKPL